MNGEGKISIEPDSVLPRLISCRRLWDRAGHNALTDLMRFQDRFFCIFREGELHVGGQDGSLVLLESGDGDSWTQVAGFREHGVDLRDPKLSITPDGRLMMLAGGSCFDPDGRFLWRQTRVAFSPDGREWTCPEPILTRGEWLWRVTWYGGKGYGLSYNPDRRDLPGGEWSLSLFETEDGLHYRVLKMLEVPGLPNEATIRFLPDQSMLALIRREQKPFTGWIGRSFPPYLDWIFREIPCRLGGPNFLVLPDGTLWAAGRGFTRVKGGTAARTMLARMTPADYEPALVLPSGGDTSYPGMVYHQGVLWMSYYSSHEEKTCVYLARIRLP